MGLSQNVKANLFREQNKSRRWETGIGGDKGDFVNSGTLKNAEIIHIYSS
jgi:hypothetical protein